MEIIGLSGKAGSGKDYLYQHSLRRCRYKRVAFADHIKVWLIGQGKLSHEEAYGHKAPDVRQLLQQYGTEQGRDVYGEDIWCSTLFAWLRVWESSWGINRFVITDVRFANEVEFIKRRGGKVFRIHAPERAALKGLSPELAEHRSECDLDTYARFDAIIHNDPGEDGIEQLKQLVLCPGDRW